jgi:hypothetical protein
VETAPGIVSAQLLDALGNPTGERIDNIILLDEKDELNLDNDDDNVTVAGGGFVRVYLDTTNGNDANSGDSSVSAFKTWTRVLLAIADTASAEITISGNVTQLTLTNCPNVLINIPNQITVANGIKITSSTVRIIGNILLSQAAKIIEANNSNVVFNGQIEATATNAGTPVTFCEAKGISVVRFKEYVIDDTALNNSTVYYNIETGSEVYVAGYAKHPNPYLAPSADPNSYTYPTA